MEWDNERLVQDVRNVLITEPDTSSEYNTSVPVEELLKGKEENPRLTEDLSFEMEELFKKRKNGFFIEAGASNGDTHSHTLLFEVRKKGPRAYFKATFFNRLDMDGLDYWLSLMLMN